MKLRMAPRMIQSMEILQLPLMALQERIDQELIENPILVDLRVKALRRRRESTATPPDDARRVRARTPRCDGSRLLGRPIRRIPPGQPGGAQRGGRPQARRHAEHGLSPRVAPRRPLRSNSATWTATPTVREFAEFIIFNLDENGFLKSSLNDSSATTAARSPPPRPKRPWRWSSGSTRPASGHGTSRSACSFSSRPTSNMPRHSARPDLQPSRRHPAESPAHDRAQDRVLARHHQGSDRPASAAQPPTWRTTGMPENSAQFVLPDLIVEPTSTAATRSA